MEKVRSRLTLLSLLSIFFIYKAITGKNSDEVVFWSFLSVFYLISLFLLFFILKKYKKDKENYGREDPYYMK